MLKLNRSFFLRLVLLCVGLIITYLGCTVFIMAGIGSDPFNVLTQGVYRTLASTFPSPIFSHGRVHIVLCTIIILILLFIDRSYIKLGTIIGMFAGGSIIDAFSVLLTPVFESCQQLWFKLLSNVIGCIIIAYGLTLVIVSNAGTAPSDLPAVVISDKLKCRFGIIRIIVDVCLTGLGFLLGGTIGIGTVICALLVGPVSDIFLPINQRLANAILND